jgi:flagellar hook-length control protein FliK
MRIGMNTSSFGSVEVRAVVHAGDIGLQIGSEKGDLRSLLSTEIPGLASTLEQQNLRLAPVSFQQHGFAFTSDLSSGGQSQQRSASSPFKSNGTPDTSEPFAAASDASEEAACSIAAGGGISILA